MLPEMAANQTKKPDDEGATAGLWLLQKLEQKRAANSSVTLRSLARRLRVSPGHFANLLSGRRNLSKEMAVRIAERLDLSPDERAALINLTGAKRGKQADATPTPEAHRLLSEDNFRLVGDWYHFGILALSDLKAMSASPKVIAQQLGIKPAEAERGLARLKKLGLVEVQNGELSSPPQSILTKNDVPSAAVRRHHKQLLHRAEMALEQVPVPKRHFEATTFAISERNVDAVKDLVREFHRRVRDLSNDDSEKDRVYNLAIQFFPTNLGEGPNE